MKKIWRVVGFIILIVLIAGLVCIAVGTFTGADWGRIYTMLDERYHVGIYIEYVSRLIAAYTPQPISG